MLLFACQTSLASMYYPVSLKFENRHILEQKFTTAAATYIKLLPLDLDPLAPHQEIKQISAMAAFRMQASNRVLLIPELMDMIFRFMDEAENATNACVCRVWSEIALDNLWREVDDLHRLFNLLAPLQLNISDGDYEFSRRPTPTDWKRFEKYSRRIRKLFYDKRHHSLHQSVFDNIARTRTSFNILPSLHTLHWKGPLELCVMFMHSNVKHFVVYIPSEPASIRPFFEDVVARMPNIAHLDICSIIPMNAIENDAIMLFRSLPKLAKVTLPRYYLTTKLAECLSRAEHLGVIEFQYYSDQGVGDPVDTASFHPTLAKGAFPVLWDLSMTIDFKNAAQFINAPFSPTNLTTLYIDSHLFESPEAIHNLLNIIAENCQLLQTLALVPVRDASASYPEPLEENEVISFLTLKPLLACPCLTSMELVHQFPLNLKQEDMEIFARTWPSLETLVLNNEPAYLEKSSLTLRALVPFAQHCPKLRHLGLFVDATSVDVSLLHLPKIPSPFSSTRYTPFHALRKLSMGISVISDENFVALFLSQLCPLHCQLDCGVTWDEQFIVPPHLAELTRSRCERWDKVAELLPLLIKLRMEERVRTRAMELELEDLKMRTGVMIGSVGMESGDICVTI